MEKYLAHSPTEQNPDGQLLHEHLENVSKLAAEFCKPFHAEDDGRLCGLYHDIGKYSDAFQRRLAGSQERVDHSSAGALLLFEKRNIPVSMCIAGHHAGLADCGDKRDLSDTYLARINHARRGEIEDFSAWQEEISAQIPVGYKSLPKLSNYFYIKMLFSALTDADWLDTEAYYQGIKYIHPSIGLHLLWEKLDNYISPWRNPQTDINIRRYKILQAAIEHGKDEPGLFSMTVPTGGGKTIASMAFALLHALQHDKRRIIYVIPYCSILEQTQGIFESIFGKEYITAHYSGAEFENPENTPDKRAYSTENWEAPIILTTAVQFFESMFSSKPGKNRKLHNIANSVIIFDEAQMLPVPFLRPCLAAICELSSHYGCTCVLCTATQPAVDPLLKKLAPELTVRELCPEPEEMYQAFRRVTYINEGLLEDEKLAELLGNKHQVLCIVNNRKQAQQLYNLMPDDEGTFHLSTLMTPFDRKRTLEIIRARLKEGQSCRVISTSLIEAGVDVDFPEVYRALAGLDSIIQAGGRCNREGKETASQSIVHIFESEKRAPLMLEQNISASRRTLKKHDPADSPEAIKDYFSFLLYCLKDEKQLDLKEILPDAEKLCFETISEKFKIIDGDDCTVYIPLSEGAAFIEQYRKNGPSRSLMRKLDTFSIGVYRSHFNRLTDLGVIEKISANSGILTDLSMYSPKIGLPLETEAAGQALFV